MQWIAYETNNLPLHYLSNSRKLPNQPKFWPTDEDLKNIVEFYAAGWRTYELADAYETSSCSIRQFISRVRLACDAHGTRLKERAIRAGATIFSREDFRERVLPLRQSIREKICANRPQLLQ